MDVLPPEDDPPDEELPEDEPDDELPPVDAVDDPPPQPASIPTNTATHRPCDQVLRDIQVLLTDGSGLRPASQASTRDASEHCELSEDAEARCSRSKT